MASRSDTHQRSVLDRVIAPVLALIAAPVIAVLAVLVRARIGKPVFFRQERAGLGGAPFTLVKLRTMTEARDEAGVLLPDDRRLTSLGRILRASSMDELPELWNVVRGEMALVGPRPLPTSYLARYSPQEGRRHDVRPGITGWAQVNGRNSTSWEDRLQMDVWYVENRSLRLDLRIVAATFRAVLRRDGISAAEHATMPELRPDMGSQG